MSDQNSLPLNHFQVLREESLLSKKRIFERAAEVLGSALELRSDVIYRALLARERLGSTAIGEGVAIPHCRVSECNEAAGCLVTLPDPIDYESGDRKEVDIIFVLLVPEDATQAHLNLLATLARKFSNAQVRGRIRGYRDQAEVRQILLGDSIL